MIADPRLRNPESEKETVGRVQKATEEPIGQDRSELDFCFETTKLHELDSRGQPAQLPTLLLGRRFLLHIAIPYSRTNIPSFQWDQLPDRGIRTVRHCSDHHSYQEEQNWKEPPRCLTCCRVRSRSSSLRPNRPQSFVDPIKILLFLLRIIRQERRYIVWIPRVIGRDPFPDSLLASVCSFSLDSRGCLVVELIGCLLLGVRQTNCRTNLIWLIVVSEVCRRQNLSIGRNHQNLIVPLGIGMNHLLRRRYEPLRIGKIPFRVVQAVDHF